MSLVPSKAKSYFSHEEDLQLLAAGDVDRYRDIFSRAAPKFFTAVDDKSSFTDGVAGAEAREAQLRVFMRAVQQTLPVLRLRGYLRVYSTAPHKKIADLLSAGDDDDAAATGGAGAKAPGGEWTAEAHVAHLAMAGRQCVAKPGAASLATDTELQPRGRIRFESADGTVTVQAKEAPPSVALALYEKCAALPPTIA